MGTPQPAPKLTQEFPATLSPWADAVSKGVAAIAIALYVSGFLIVSLHHSRYGFAETDPFRARIIAAGAWFCFLSCLPIIGLRRLHGGIVKVSWTDLAAFSYPYYASCLFLTLLIAPFFEFSGYSDWPGPVPQGRWILFTLLLLGVLIFLIEWKKSPKMVAAIASMLLALFYAHYPAQDLLVNHKFEMTAITLWLFGVGVVSVVEVKTRLKAGDWEKSVFLILGALSVFAWSYYPHVKASWGGGVPVHAMIYFTKDSALSPNKSVSAQVIEESDQGFYIVGANESKAIYVPRSAISLVYYSDNAGDSALLRDNK